MMTDDLPAQLVTAAAEALASVYGQPGHPDHESAAQAALAAAFRVIDEESRIIGGRNGYDARELADRIEQGDGK